MHMHATAEDAWVLYAARECCMSVYVLACRVLGWAQQVMGRTYLVGDQLSGEDVKDSAAPQVGGMLRAKGTTSS